MGQYHLTVNLDKKEFIRPHQLGLGSKLREQFGFEGSMGDILFLLLASSNGRGGGDADTQFPKLVGRWAGDRIAVIGDYSEADDIPGVNAKDIYSAVSAAYHDNEENGWKNISDELVPLVNEQFGCNLNTEHSGWRNRDGSSHPDWYEQMFSRND